MLTGKQLALDHPLLRGSAAEEHLRVEGIRSGETPIDARSAQGAAGTDESVGNDDLTPRITDVPVTAGEEEAQILTESWLDSPNSRMSSTCAAPREGEDRTLSPPSSHFASVNASHEDKYAWSPAAMQATSSSVEHKYDDDDAVNQSLNASIGSDVFARDCRHSVQFSASTRGVQSPPSSRASSVGQSSPGAPFEPRSPEEQEFEAAGARHRGTIAARAMMGRKRVYGAVVIQRWFRVLLQRQTQEQRDDVKKILRERREKAQADQQKRREEEDSRAASLRSEREESVKAALEHREEEVERATQRLRRTMQASVPLRAAHGTANSSGVVPRSSTDSPSRLSSAGSPLARAPPSGSESFLDPTHSPRQVETAAGSQEEQSLMDALRASVERSADMLGLVRGSGSPLGGSHHKSASGGHTSSPNANCRTSVLWPPKTEDQSHGGPTVCGDVAAEDEGDEAGRAAGERSLLQSPTASPARGSSATSSPARMSDVLRRRALAALEPVAVATSSQAVSPVRSPSQKSPDERRIERRGNMDAAAKEVQTSILSFLDAVEANVSGVNASMSNASGINASMSTDGGDAHGFSMQTSSQGPRRALALPDGDAAHSHSVRPPPSPSLASRASRP